MQPFIERMTEYAYGVVKGRKKNLCYINFVLNVTPDCDCAPWSDMPLVPDVGIFLQPIRLLLIRPVLIWFPRLHRSRRAHLVLKSQTNLRPAGPTPAARCNWPMVRPLGWAAANTSSKRCSPIPASAKQSKPIAQPLCHPASQQPFQPTHCHCAERAVIVLFPNQGISCHKNVTKL